MQESWAGSFLSFSHRLLSRLPGGGSGSEKASRWNTTRKSAYAWVLIAVVFDYLFIVQLFQATYYEADVFVYYAMTFLIPVGVGFYLIQKQNKL